MPARVTLKVTEGKLAGQEFVFAERNSCIIGRADDCMPKLPDDQYHATISRHHCLLDINPPDVRIRDFGSRNGTYVNGEKIGQRGEHMTPEEAAALQFPERDLKAGDTIKLGRTVFQVGIFVPAACIECDAEIPDDQRAAAELAPNVFRCAACRKKAPAAAPPPPRPKRCLKCGKDVAAEVGENRYGDFVCAACQADPFAVLQRLLAQAKDGEQSLVAIDGYRILKELGQGGMGAVYLARHDRTGEQVALKVMLPKVALNEHARKSFLDETANTQALNHPNIVKMRDYGCSQGTFFFTMEFCTGGSIDALMEKQGGVLSLAEAGPLMLQTLAGLHYAHNVELAEVPLIHGVRTSSRGLVHRDLKPHNIFLAGAGTARVAKIGDFGLAKSFDVAGLSGRTRTGDKAGTPYFMPRQQVINFKYAKPEVDVWAAVASFYFMLTGVGPRDFVKGKDPWQIVLQTSAVPIRERKASIPRKVAEVIDLALQDKPAIPFKSAADLRRALEEAL